MTERTPSDPDAENGLRAQAEAVGRALADDLRRVLSDLPDFQWRPQTLAALLHQTVATAGRTLRAVGHPNPLGTLLQAPGPQPLRRVLVAARDAGADDKFVRAASASVDAFDQLLREQEGGRAAFASVLSSWIPEARREFELRRRQALFRAYSEWRGAQQDVELASMVISRSKEPGALDVTMVQGLFGVMRHRPDVQVEIEAIEMIEIEGEREPSAVEIGNRKQSGPFGVGRLDRFCLNPPAKLNTITTGDQRRQTLASKSYGSDSLADCIVAHHHEGAMKLEELKGEHRTPYLLNIQATPVHKLLLDLWVANDLLVEQDPELFVYAVHGKVPAWPLQPDRELDRIDTLDEVELFEGNSPRLAVPEVPTYVPMMKEVLFHLGLQPSEFRVARVAMDYPVFGTQSILRHPLRTD